MSEKLVVVKGGGDLASGVIYRLLRARFPVIVTELATPLFVRRTVSFGEAVYQGEVYIEGIKAQRVDGPDAALALAAAGGLPVVVDAQADIIKVLRPALVVDGIMAKVNTGTRRDDAPLVVALGPGFTAGVDCHAVVETMRGHWLGRLIYDGAAAADTGTPGLVAGRGVDRVLRAPAAGHVHPSCAIGDRVEADELIATVSGQESACALCRRPARHHPSGRDRHPGNEDRRSGSPGCGRALFYDQRQGAGHRRGRAGGGAGQISVDTRLPITLVKPLGRYAAALMGSGTIGDASHISNVTLGQPVARSSAI